MGVPLLAKDWYNNDMNKKTLYFILFAFHLLVVLYFWWNSSGPSLTSGNLDSALIAIARLSGLILVSLIFLQVMLMGRARWLEPVFGLDKLARIHHKVGRWILVFLILHPALLIYSYADLSQISLWKQYIDFALHYEDVLNASIAFLIFLFIIVYSILMVRRKWNFELWYISHLSVYVAILLSFGHQTDTGGDFLSSSLFVWYWYAVYAFVFGNLAIYRFLRPLWLYNKHQFKVEKLIPETADVTSVYITGKEMDHFTITGGQFMIVRFLDKKRWWQAHPFSLSKHPDGKSLRLSIKASGNYTSTIKDLAPGTKVFIEGPYGVFTAKKSTKDKVVLIAGGIGITPIRALLEDLLAAKKDITLIYGNRTRDDVALRGELEPLSQQYRFPIHHILSNETEASLLSTNNLALSTFHTGFLTKELMQKLTPDVATREVYLCGPPPMMNAVIKVLVELGVDKKYIYYERFSLS